MKKIMTHIVAGYPSLEESKKLIRVMAGAGVSYIEIQIPFSDPLADGPTIMRANQVALENGTTPEDAFQLMRELKQEVNVPLLFMTYFNIVFHYGVEAFCKRAKEAGCYGLIIPDFPIEEEQYDRLRHHAKENGIHIIEMLTPYTKPDRVEEILQRASGMIYCVARSGKTGEREKLDTSQLEYLDEIKKKTTIPLAVGFGISSGEHVDAVLRYGDIAVIGSKIINVYNAAENEKGLESVQKFISEVISNEYIKNEKNLS